MAEKRFDKQLARLLVVSIIAFFVAVICLIASLVVIIRFQMFIQSFEYVEETTYTIEQDEGTNTAIIGGESNEVNIWDKK
jgi:phosphotransferase system  glucose/maltose/N-acetylglucosamine-specific IIC component